MGPDRQTSAATQELRHQRPEIQALRALAVLLVVGFHLWPEAIPAGFVGVDVFFAISGFLITSLLLREIERTGGISLASFWARRARRLFPAALVVVLFCALATLAFIPVNHWEQVFGDLRASTLYTQNWHLAATATDYFAAAEGPTPVKHFWTLSAEEQFYVVWPLLMVAALVATRRRTARVRRRAIAAVLTVVCLVSVAYSIAHTAADPADAYFATTTRAWEFAAGGLLALAGSSVTASDTLRAALSWLGLGAIGVAAFAYTIETPLPGAAAALPVAGTLAVIAGGAPALRWAPTRALTARPAQVVGDLSYSIYLWHWPLLILTPTVLGGPLHTTTKAVILVLTFLLSWMSKVLVEDPVRRGRFLARRPPRWTFVSAACAGSLALGVTALGDAHVREQVRDDERRTAAVLAGEPDCFGAAARDPERPCRNAALRAMVVPSPVQARRQTAPTCEFLDADRFLCAFRSPAPEPTQTVALIGDSHAGHWREALELTAGARSWRGLAVVRTGCAFSAAERALEEPRRSGCARWNKRVVHWLGHHPEVKTVFQSQVAGGRSVVTGRRDKFAAAVDGYLARWRSLPPSVENIVVLRDTPGTTGRTPACIQRAMERRRDAGVTCAQARGPALPRDPVAVAARKSRDPRVKVVDMTPFFCGSARCHPVVGGALVYKDDGHLTDVFARSLGPFVQRELDRLLPQ
jgi:peptidoglycan/LPS O-acetylase OafA/YrhL